MFNKYRLKIGKGPVVYRCGTLKKREYFFKCKLAKYNRQRLFKIVLCKWKNNLRVYLLREGVKDFRI